MEDSDKDAVLQRKDALRGSSLVWEGAVDNAIYADVPGGFIGISFMEWSRSTYVFYQAVETENNVVPVGDDIEIAFFKAEGLCDGIERGKRLGERWWSENGAGLLPQADHQR